MIPELQQPIEDLFQGHDLTAETMETAILAIMDGQASEAAIAAFLTALRMKGEAVDELVGAARAMRRKATPVRPQTVRLLDTCGTGGDALHTFNISTATAIVAAGAGVPVAKHGNRSVSSSSGSADVLEALGVAIDLTPETVAQCIDEVGLGFCFAPLIHGAMKYAAPVRRELGFRSIFNLLGPLTNPASAEFQLLGTGRPEAARMMAAALAQLGTRRSLVVCGNAELDEVCLWGPTEVWVVEAGEVRSETWTPDDLGLPECSVEDVRVESPEESVAVIRDVFSGKPGPARNLVVANTAAALLAAGKCDAVHAAVELAAATLDAGQAEEKCRQLAEWTQQARGAAS